MKISELQINQNCEITLVVKSAQARETRAKKPYLALDLFDGTDTIKCMYWDWTSGNIPPNNTILDVTGQVTEYQGIKQINIKTIKTNTVRHINEFMPTSGNDIAEVYKNAYSLASDVINDTLRSIALGVLERLKNEWLTIPGAVNVHHNYAGGTLVHSVNVAKIAGEIAKCIPEADVDLCIIGGLLHDVGKLFTYKIDGISIDMTSEGMLYEHIFMGAEFIGNFSETIVDADDPENYAIIRLLRHIILSHHGCREFGSPITPACIEAYIVSKADGIDSVAEQIRVASKGNTDKIWTDKIYYLDNKPHINPAYVKHTFRTVMNNNDFPE